MREIKFRGKSELAHQWRYGSLIMIDKHPHIVEDCEIGLDGHHIRQTSDRPTWIIPDTIGQFTGLGDANGREIYEGDVLRLEDEEKAYGVVVWHPKGYFAIDYHFGKCDLLDYDYRPLGEMLYHRLRSGKLLRFVVLDNIHNYKEDEL